MIRLPLVVWFLVWTLSCLGIVQAAETRESPSAQEIFQQGVAAYRDDDNEQALKAFVKARERGLDKAALHYNPGVILYRMGRHEQAAGGFERLIEQS